ncbi:hypothetical protein [uncultured Erythrobacter sp.]|uniref:hypothetical protein n=1 Tax=uncultured Erythrobacter sp. TaxID=263913 RepID=UPI0026110248|nr:hypothetical protein [uncultured Erythrobacter sp.]
MRALPIAAATLLALTTPSVAFAEDVPADAPETALAEMSRQLADPDFQAQAATIAQVLVGTLLDLQVGPLAEAVNEATGGEGPAIDPDARVRDLAPGAEDLPDEVSERLPDAMNAMSGMAEGMQTMLPALRDMAERMRASMEQVRLDR